MPQPITTLIFTSGNQKCLTNVQPHPFFVSFIVMAFFGSTFSSVVHFLPYWRVWVQIFYWTSVACRDWWYFTVWTCGRFEDRRMIGLMYVRGRADGSRLTAPWTQLWIDFFLLVGRLGLTATRPNPATTDFFVHTKAGSQFWRSQEDVVLTHCNSCWSGEGKIQRMVIWHLCSYFEFSVDHHCH